MCFMQNPPGFGQCMGNMCVCGGFSSSAASGGGCASDQDCTFSCAQQGGAPCGTCTGGTCACANDPADCFGDGGLPDGFP